LNLWQHVAHLVGAGRVSEVEATIDYVRENGADYDRSFFCNLTTESGLVGRLAQDVITQPKKKFLHLQCEQGSLGWYNDVTKTTDEVRVNPHGGEPRKEEIAKTRVEEFGREIAHLQGIIEGRIDPITSPVRLERAVDTMLVLAAAHQSQAERRRIKIDYAPWQIRS
jgi:predicted dehydrogenase